MADARGLVQTTLTQLRASGISTREECTAALCAKLHSSITNPEQLKTLATEVIDAEFGCHVEEAPTEEGVAEEALGEAAEEAGAGVVMDEASTDAVVVGLAAEAVATETVATETVATEAVATEAVAAEGGVVTEAATGVAVNAAPVDVAGEVTHDAVPTPTDVDLMHAKIDALIDAQTTMQARIDELCFLVEHTVPQSSTATRKQLASFSESFLFPRERSNHEKYRAAINGHTDLRAAVNKFLLERHGVRETTTSPTAVSDDIIA